MPDECTIDEEQDACACFERVAQRLAQSGPWPSAMGEGAADQRDSPSGLGKQLIS
jgi:hypothetical protein